MPKKRPDGRYAKQITIGTQENGKPKKKTIYGKTIRELEQKEREFLNMMDKGIVTTTDDLTVRELAELYNKYKKKSVADTSFRTIKTYSNKVIEYLGHMKVKDVKLFHLDAFIDDQRETLSDSSANILIIRLKEIFEYAVEKDMIYRSPAQSIKLLKQSDPIKRMLTDYEKELFEGADFNESEKCFVYILRYTGMRRGEILALGRQDIDLQGKKISITKTLADNGGKPYIKQSPKTDASRRDIPILDPLYPVLKGYCENRIGLLFTNEKGKLLSNQSVDYFWTRILSKVMDFNKGQPIADDITPHMFRHTFASDLYDAGIDIKRAQYILGHKSIKTTLDIYTHFDKTKLKADEMNLYYRQSKESQLSNAKV